MASALTAQKAFLNNFKDINNRRVDIREDIKHYQDTLSYASSDVDYSMGENLYMLPSNMNLNIKTGTARYNNKILTSDGKFNLGKNDKVNAFELTPKISHKQTITHAQKQAITHEDEKVALVLSLAGGFVIWHAFRQKKTKPMSGCSISCLPLGTLT